MLFDHLHATAFQFTPLGRPILGPAANVRAITRDHLAAYIGEHYTASRMVVVGAGAVEHEELCALASAAFSALPRGAPGDAARLCAASPAHFTGSEVRMRDDDRQAIALAVAVAGAPWADPASVPLMVMQSMLGSWDRASSAGVNASSPVAQAIAANGLASSYTAFNTNYHDSGLFGFHAVLDSPDHADDAAYVLMDGLAKLAYEVDPDQLLRAKEQLKSSLMLHTEGGSSAAAEDIGRQLLTYGERKPPADFVAAVNALTTHDVAAAVAKLLRTPPTFAVIGDAHAAPRLAAIERRFA